MSFEGGFDPGDFNGDGKVNWRDQSDQYYAANHGTSNGSGSGSSGNSAGCGCLLFVLLIFLILAMLLG